LRSRISECQKSARQKYFKREEHNMSLQAAGLLQSPSAAVTLDREFRTLDERELVVAAKLGESEAFEILCERSLQKVFQATRRLTKNREDAEDALQDSLMRAFVHIKDFDGRASFATWLTRIAINSALMLLRKRRASREISVDGSNTTQSYWEVPDHAPNPEKRYARRERGKILQNAVHGLRPAIREVVELQQFHGYSLKEVAAHVGISVSAAKARLFHAKLALRKSSRLRTMGYGAVCRPIPHFRGRPPVETNLGIAG
jgi:RNA polymerase sigma factor (sigma-70 family)